MINKIKFDRPQFFKGSNWGVSGATALVTLNLEGKPGEVALRRLMSYKVLASLNSADPHFAVDPDNWISSFVRNVPEQPGLAHIIAAYAVAFQRWARDPVCKAVVITRAAPKIQLALPYYRPEVLTRILVLTARFVDLTEMPKPTAEQWRDYRRALAELFQHAHRNYLAPNTVRFALAASERNIPVTTLNHDTIQLGWGANQIRLRSSFTGATSTVASSLARQKQEASGLLRSSRIPVPRGTATRSIEDAEKVARQLGWPVVVKPAGLDQGVGVTPGISGLQELQDAFTTAQSLHKGPIIVEEHIQGDDHRMLVVKGQLLMTTRRVPAAVTGDGTSDISQLIEKTNLDPRRGKGKRNLMAHLKLDDAALQCLREQGLEPGDIPDDGQFVALNKTANISTGGTAIDVSDKVHPDNRAAAIRAARLVGLDIAGVDFLCPDISQSYRDVGGAICEVNAQPGFRPHWLSDPERDINGEVIDILTGGGATRIPTAAITGTNGKSTTAKMLHAIWQAAGKTAGVSTTAGTWIGDDKIDSTNLSGFPGAQVLFRDPAVESAILEVPRKGLLLYGHPCDSYDVAALLNIADDHIGVDGINSLEAMAKLKSQVIARAKRAVVLNADDHLCLAMRRYVVARTTLLTARHKSNAALSAHLNNKGWGAYVKGSGAGAILVLAEGDREIELLPVSGIPATEGGLIEHNILNATWAAALAWLQGVKLGAIRQGLAGFTNDIANNPGRYNYVDGLPYKLMIDYAHNADSASTVIDYIEKLDIKGSKILLSSKLGNRHREDFTRIAPRLAEVFDEIVVTPSARRVKNNPEYASDDPEATMLAFAEKVLLEEGQQANALHTTKNLESAVIWALAKAGPEDFVLVLGDLADVLPLIRQHGAGKG